MARKLFCEYNRFFYKISQCKEAGKKNLRDLLQGRHFAKKHDKQNLPFLWKGDMRIMMRKLEGVNQELQANKVTNLRLAAGKIDGLVIRPGEEFSFWNTVGTCTRRRGYLDGLVISNRKLTQGIGGGLCQMANLIHWLVLHSPLTVTELHHHSDALFPDERRRVPFGTGTSISYKALDYRFKNTSDTPVQIRVWLDDTFLYGELRADAELKEKYRIEEEDDHYAQEADGVFYRNSKVYRFVTDRETGALIRKELILDNHSEVLFDYALIPQDKIRVTKACT